MSQGTANTNVNSWEEIFTAMDAADQLLTSISEGQDPQENEMEDVLDRLTVAENTLDRWQSQLDLKPQTRERFNSNLKHVKGLIARLEKAEHLLCDPPTGECWAH